MDPGIVIRLPDSGLSASPLAADGPVIATDEDVFLFRASFAQERLWFVDQLDPGNSAYSLPILMRVTGELALPALERALNEVVRRHEILRTTFSLKQWEVVQVISPLQNVRVTTADLSDVPETECEERARSLTNQEIRRPFDLRRGPLFRAHLWRLNAREHLLLLNMHHIVADGWSLRVLVHEIAALYEAFRQDRGSPLPELSLQYADFAQWQRELLKDGALEEHVSFWKETLAGVPPVLDLRTDRPRPQRQTFRGAYETELLPPHLSDRIKALSRQEGVTPFMTLLAAFFALLYRHTGQTDIAVGSPIANRNRVELEPLIGLFMNTLVLRGDLSGNPTFRELLARVARTAVDAYSHQDMPFERLVEELKQPRDRSRNPVFQVMFVHQRAFIQPFDAGGLRFLPLRVDRGGSLADLCLFVIERDEGLRAGLEYNTDLFEVSTIRRMLGHFQNLLESAIADPDRRLSALSLMSDEERRQVLVEWNETEGEYPRGATGHGLFELQVERTPDAVALVFGRECLTYRQLNERANRLAGYLRRRGVGPEVLVGLCVERSLEMVVGLLGILKAGGAYVPLDPGYPRQRVEFMVKDSGVSVVLTQEGVSPVLPEGDFERVRLDADWPEIERESGENPESGVRAENLAYVIYTSGSTGTPKGVAVEHRSVVNLLLSMRDWLGPKEDDVLLAITTLSFDIAGLELYLPLITGACVAVAARETVQDGRALRDQLVQCGATMMQGTPTSWRLLLDAGWRGESLRAVLCGGEALSRDLADRLLEKSPLVWNLYGPTETTIWSTGCQVKPDTGTVPIGTPLANTQVYILDADGVPVPVGLPGDLYVAGAGVARGYLNRPELTKEKFLPDPFRGDGARMYRTGDRARFLPDGNIQFLGRLDDQVKIRGYRIEIGEIEESLSRHPGVQACAVIARQEESGNTRLIAYLVPRHEVRPSVGELRGFSKRTLPDYMIPLTFQWLDALPLTPNGKIDRRALPIPPPDRPDLDTPFCAPRTSAEKTLCEMCSELLSLETVGIDDNFFELGGHSVIATQFVSRIRTAFRVEVPLSQFFKSPTVRETAGWILRAKREDGQGDVSIPRTPRTGNNPLSLPQENVWFLQNLQPDNRAYYFQPTLRFHGRVDADVLRRSLDEIVRRHEIYRTTFPAVEAAPVQQIHESAAASLAVFDLQDLPEEQREAELRRRIDEEIRRPFDLTKLPLIRWTLLRLGPEEYVLQHVEHHMLHDGWAFNVFLRELATLYRSFRLGAPSPLPEPEIQFADFARFQRRWLETEQAAAQKAYWTKKLSPPPAALEIPSDRPRPAVRAFRGAAPNVELPVDLAESLRALSRRQGCTLFMTMLATFATMLSRYTRREDFCIGSGVANRRWTESEGLLGMLVNVVPLRMDLGGDPTFTELLRRVRDVALEGYENQDYPFAGVVEAVAPERSLSHLPLCQVLFSFHDSPLGELDFGGMQLADLKEIVSNGSAKFDLNIVCIPRSEQRVGHRSKAPAGGITIAWEYDTDLFDEATACRMIGHFETLLRAVAADPERRVSSLPLLTEAEKHDILLEWTSRPTASPRTCLNESFERQVERSPDAVAVEFEGDRLTYAELNRRCNQVAWHLRKLGVEPGMLVGVCLERSLEMVVAVIAVLKSGGAYVPLDPDYPAERLAFILEDAQTPVLLTEERLLESLQVPRGVSVCLMDQDAQVIGREDGRNPERLGSPESPAYVIYTSGSTGKPKGVLVTHANVDRLFTATEPWFRFDGQDVWTLFHSYAFDFSVWELWGALRYGGRLVVVPLTVARAPELFHALLARSGVTVLNQTPSAFRQLIARDASSFASLSLRLVIFGGEALEPGILEPWFDRHGDESPSLVNMYGITETTVHVTYHPVTRADLLQPSVSMIGRPIPDLQIYILDPYLQLCPIGIPGELHVAGAGLALGYLRRPGLTGERFIHNPFATEPGERLYKTGDLGRYRPGGEIEYLGRIDQQVKIRGYRIELGEIETVLKEHPGVREAVVIAWSDGDAEKRLFAYFVPASADVPVAGALRRHLAKKLPDYMLPSGFIPLESIPLTPNGKVDRAALPSPDGRRPEGVRFVPPSTAVEKALADVWKSILKVDRVGVDDNFFELGGHSLLATLVISRVRDRFGVELPIRTLFESATLAAFAEALSNGLQNALPPITPVDRESWRARAMGPRDAEAAETLKETDETVAGERSGPAGGRR